jgi:hypothetical protein
MVCANFPARGHENNRNNKYFIIIIYAFGTAHVKHGSINQHVLQLCSTPEPGELINLFILINYSLVCCVYTRINYQTNYILIFFAQVRSDKSSKIS